MKSVVLAGGGVDGAVLTSYAIKEHGVNNVTVFSCNYGQKATQELESIKNYCEFLGVKNITMDFEEIFKTSNCPNIKGNPNPIPHGSVEEQTYTRKGAPLECYIPFMVGLFASAATSYAFSTSAARLYMSTNVGSNIRNAYPDGSKEFLKNLSGAIAIGTGNQVEVFSPFMQLEKHDLIKLGEELKTPLNLTWSCYDNHKNHCGECSACIARKEAFEKAGIKDPTVYEI